MRRIALILLSLVLTGCGAKSAQPPKDTPTSTPLTTYHDSAHGFSFKYPATWNIAKPGGHTVAISGVQTYVLDLNTPNQEAGVRLTVDRDLKHSEYATIPEGKAAPYGASTLHYHHLTVASWPSIQIERFTSRRMDGIYTITNTRQYSYQVQMIAAQPPFTSDALQGYKTIVRTLKVPF